MKTSKPIATISYNTELYLRDRLEENRKAGKIRFWAFIRHLGEDDDGGAKDHFHVFLEPATRIDADKLLAEFAEIDFKKPDKPLRCLSPRSSDFGNWYRYCLHDEAYLSSKLETRTYHYRPEDFCFSDPDEMNRRVKSIPVDNTQIARLKRAVQLGMSFNEVLWVGLVNPQNVRNVEIAYRRLQDEHARMQRGGTSCKGGVHKPSSPCEHTLHDVDLPYDGEIRTRGLPPDIEDSDLLS